MSDPDEPRRGGVVILGVPRSGTTLLRRLFDAHPSFACPGESFLLTAAAKFLQTQPAAEGLEVGVCTGLSWMGFPTEEVIARLREFTFAFHREHAARVGKPRWADKTAPDVFHIREIELLCGDAVDYVCILRHALDVIVSMREMIETTQRWVNELHPYIVRHPRPLEALAHAWVDGTRAMLELARRRPERVQLLRYEDLVQRPAATLEGVMARLGERWPDGLEAGALRAGEFGMGDWKINGKSGIEGTSVGRGASAISRVTSLELGPIVNDTLEACGYERLPEGPRPSQERARKLYEVAMKVQPLRTRQKP